MAIFFILPKNWCGYRPCHGPGVQPPASHCGGPGSIAGQFMWDLWWTKWHWNRFPPECFGFPLSLSFLRCSITRQRTKSNHHLHLQHTVAQEALRLRCARSICCGALLRKKSTFYSLCTLTRPLYSLHLYITSQLLVVQKLPGSFPNYFILKQLHSLAVTYE
jgi:hypothetical protein